MANPTYQSGFYAPGRGTALHPELWDGCVGAWNPGLGNTGLSLRDWSGNQNNGVLTNGPTWGVSGGQQALTLDGTNDYVDCGTTTTATTLRNVPMSISVWFRLNGNYGAIQSMVSNLGGAGSNVTYQLEFGRTANEFSWLNNSAAIASVSSVALSDNNWHHVTAVRSGSLSAWTISWYLDGVFDESDVTTGNSDATNGKLSIGRPGEYNGQYFKGQIADARIYNRALSPNEIRTLAQRPGIAYELAPRKFYSLPAAATGNPAGILQNNIQSIRLGL